MNRTSKFDQFIFSFHSFNLIPNQKSTFEIEKRKIDLEVLIIHACTLLRSEQKSWRCGERVSGLCVVGVLTFCCSTLCKSEGGGDADHGDRLRHFVRVGFFGWLHVL